MAAAKQSYFAFDAKALPFDTKNVAHVQVRPGEEHFGPCCTYIAEHATSASSFRIVRTTASQDDDSDEDNNAGEEVAELSNVLATLADALGSGKSAHSTESKVDSKVGSKIVPVDDAIAHASKLLEKNRKKIKTKLSLAPGVFQFTHNGHQLRAVLQNIGDPVGTSCGPKQYETLVIFSDSSSVAIIADFITYVLARSMQQTKKGFFNIHKWHPRHQYWQRKGTSRARSIESVVLPMSTIGPLLEDLQLFLGKDARKFYRKHGVPYRRSYLFYGVPGTGKTSLIQALAGKLGRGISYMQPTHPDMTDDSLQAAVSQLPDKTIVVFEDIDSLFDNERKGRVVQSKLTFSGLLNALDGVGGSQHGQIFILTTNLRDQLDPALIRSGRVDMHVPFSHATPEQMQMIWRRYYPDSTADMAKAFAKGVVERSAKMGRETTASELQGFFLANRLNDAATALGKLDLLTDEMKRRVEDQAIHTAAAKKKQPVDKKIKSDEGAKE